ncbi:MAG: EamA family transporter [Cyanobacteria bacterium J06632_22]
MPPLATKSPGRPPLLPPPTLVILSVISTQVGSAFAKTLFGQVGPLGIVFLRVGLGALILLVLWRPRPTAEARRHWRSVAGFAIALTLMNSLFYLAIARIPLGIAVALEFTGPLGLAVFKSRRWMDGLWATLAAMGVLLLAPLGAFSLDWVGIVLALAAGGCWAAYILMSARVGQALPGVDGLTWAMALGACLLAPIGISSAGAALLQPNILLTATGVALMSSVLPYSFELTALRTLPINVFGVLLSLEPMTATLAGMVILGETLTVRAFLAVLLISTAAAGSACFQPRLK